jgi:hypothetical protein
MPLSVVRFRQQGIAQSSFGDTGRPGPLQPGGTTIWRTGGGSCLLGTAVDVRRTEAVGLVVREAEVPSPWRGAETTPRRGATLRPQVLAAGSRRQCRRASARGPASVAEQFGSRRQRPGRLSSRACRSTGPRRPSAPSDSRSAINRERRPRASCRSPASSAFPPVLGLNHPAGSRRLPAIR